MKIEINGNKDVEREDENLYSNFSFIKTHWYLTIFLKQYKN